MCSFAELDRKRVVTEQIQASGAIQFGRCCQGLAAAEQQQCETEDYYLAAGFE